MRSRLPSYKSVVNCGGGGGGGGFPYDRFQMLDRHTGRVVDVPLTDRAHVHDLHATILLLGLDHLKLTFKFQG